MDYVNRFYAWMIEVGDPRVEEWLLMKTPIPIALIYISYLAMVWIGPKLMSNIEPFGLKYIMTIYNIVMVILSAYMCYEFFISAFLAGYSLVCQPVDYSNNPLAIRMASVCWWYFFSKVIELLDTAFFILRKKNNQISFLHVYHHSTMLINWWIGAKYIAGGQSFFLAMCNTFVHIIMYSYYALSGLGPQVQKYLWWKKYLTKLQLTQFVIVIIHTGLNCYVDCHYPKGFNYVVIMYAITLILLFSNFYKKSYKKNEISKHAEMNGVAKTHQNTQNASNSVANGQQAIKRHKKYY